MFICAVLWSVTIQSVPWLRRRHQSGSRKYVNTYTLWISLPAYLFRMDSLAMDIRRFLKRPSVLPLPQMPAKGLKYKVSLKKINSHFKTLFWFEKHRIKTGTNAINNVLSNTTMQVTSQPSRCHLNRPNKMSIFSAIEDA